MSGERCRLRFEWLPSCDRCLVHSDELLRAVTVGLQSADASVRSQAESALEVMKSSPKQFAESILRNISTGVDPSSEQMLAVVSAGFRPFRVRRVTDALLCSCCARLCK